MEINVADTVYGKKIIIKRYFIFYIYIIVLLNQILFIFILISFIENILTNSDKLLLVFLILFTSNNKSVLI